MAIAYNASTFSLAKADIKKAFSNLNIALSDSKTALNYIPNDLLNKNKLYTSKNKIEDLYLRTDSLMKVLIDSENKLINANKTTTYSMGSTSYVPVTSILSGTTSIATTGATTSGGPNIFEQIGSAIADGASSFIDGFGDISEDLINWGKDTLDGINKTGASIAQSAGSALKGIVDEASIMFESAFQLLESTAATITTSATSLLKGVMNLAESIVDAAAILGGVLISIGTITIDFGGSLLGQDFNLTENLTENGWNNLMANVSKKHVNGWFDDYYANNEFGKWANENAFSGFKNGEIGTDILEGVGYVAGTILLTIATAGVYGAVVGGTAAATAGTGLAATAGYNALVGAGIAAFAGFGKGAETSWGDGATLGEGLLYAAGNALIEGSLWYVGGKINAGKFVNTSTLLGQFKNALIKTGFETLTGAFEFPARIFIQNIYKEPIVLEDGTVLSVWDQNGGWGAYATNVGIAGVSSLLGESLEILFAKKPTINIEKVDEVIKTEAVVKQTQKFMESRQVNNLYPDGVVSVKVIDKYRLPVVDIPIEEIIDILTDPDEYNKFMNFDETYFKYGNKYQYANAIQVVGANLYENVSDVAFDMDSLKRLDNVIDMYNQAINAISDKNASQLFADSHRKMIIDFDSNGTVYKIPLDVNKSTQTITIDLMMQKVQALPESLRATIKEVNIYDFANPDDNYWKVAYGMDNFVSAATGGKGVINIFEGTSAAALSIDHIMSHEAAHTLDQVLKTRMGLSTNLSDSDIWKQAISSDLLFSKTASPTWYGTRSPAEDFAESVAMYLEKHDWFVKTFPERTKILDGIIK